MDQVAAAALVTGTGVGGGFLALPLTTAPAGCVPSAIVMIVIWLLLYGQAVVLTDIICDATARAGTPVSYSTVARSALGTVGGRLVSFLCLALMQLILIAQFSKGGHLLSVALGLPYLLGIALVGGFLSAFALVCNVRLVGLTNSVLTLGFIAAVGVLFVVGAPLAQWSRLGRADWSHWWDQIPVFLQILVYLEVLPTLCRLLHFDRWRIRIWAFVGALWLLLLDLGWSALGLSLVPFTAAGGGHLAADPLTVLLGAGGAVAWIINILAACAIATTIIGTNLALQTFFMDVCRSRRQHLAGPLCVVAVATPMVVAAWSPGIFFRAIGLSGSYPVTILWGCIPPLISLQFGLPQQSRLPRTKLALVRFIFAISLMSVIGRAFIDFSRAMR